MLGSRIQEVDLPDTLELTVYLEMSYLKNVSCVSCHSPKQALALGFLTLYVQIKRFLFSTHLVRGFEVSTSSKHLTKVSPSQMDKVTLSESEHRLQRTLQVWGVGKAPNEFVGCILVDLGGG